LDGAENLAKTPFWENPPDTFAAILGDGNLPSNQYMLRGFSICRVVRYYGSNALESTTRSCIPCGTLLESKLRGGLDFLY
jgi:hypothetical protein